MESSENPMLDQLIGRAHIRKPLQIKRLLPLALVLFPGLFYIAPAYAYLDPGSGSIILQSLLAGIATAAALVSLSWQRLKAFLLSLFSTRKLTGPDSEAGVDK
jgi:hypothetical protein